MDSGWENLAKLLHMTAAFLAKGWKVLPPPMGTAPDAETERACDECCRQLARDPSELLNAPGSVKPWILARLLHAEAVAKIVGEQSTDPAPLLRPSTIEHFLIDEWYGELGGRERWLQRQSHNGNS